MKERAEPLHAVDVLSGEHRIIEKVLKALEAMIREIRQTGRVDKAAANSMIDFFRHFADGSHHAKEERILFPYLESKGFSPDQGPVRVMLMEHEYGRKCIRAMESALRSHKVDGDEAAEIGRAHV